MLVDTGCSQTEPTEVSGEPMGETIDPGLVNTNLGAVENPLQMSAEEMREQHQSQCI